MLLKWSSQCCTEINLTNEIRNIKSCYSIQQHDSIEKQINWNMVIK